MASILARLVRPVAAVFEEPERGAWMRSQKPSWPAATIRVTDVVASAADTPAAKMGGELVMMSVEAGKYFGLSPAATRVWEILDKPMRVGDLIALLASEYAEEEAVIERDVCAFLSDLEAQGLITVVR